MKPQPIHFVGLDVHQSTVVACVRDGSGNVVMRATVPTEQKAIVALVRNASWPRIPNSCGRAAQGLTWTRLQP